MLTLHKLSPAIEAVKRSDSRSLRLTISLIALSALLNWSLSPRPSIAADDSQCAFNQRKSFSIKGNLMMLGNTLLHCDPDTPGSACTPEGNNRLPQKYVRKGPASSSGQRIFNSSSAILDLPSGAKVTYAALYWGASLHENPGLKPEDQKGKEPADCKQRGEDCKQRRKQVLFLYPGKSDYEQINADELIYPTNPNDLRTYHCFRDVTGLLRGKSGLLEFAVANVQTARGVQRHASWNLVVVYENPVDQNRNLTLFDGYCGGPNLEQVIRLKDFTAAASQGNTYLWTFAYEGDRHYNSDSLRFNGEFLFLDSAGSRRGQRNFFNSQIFDITGVTNRPDKQHYINTTGIDIHRDRIAATSGIQKAELRLDTRPRNNERGPDGVTLGAAAVVIDTAIPASADLAVIKSAPAEACVGDPVIYRISVTNSGPDAANDVVVTDNLPDDVILDPLPPGCKKMNDSVKCDLGKLNPGEPAREISLTVRATEAAVGMMTNSAEVTAREFDPNPENNQVTATTKVISKANLRITQKASSEIACVGDLLSYAIDVFNDGPNKARDVVLTDTLPANVVLDALPPNCARSGNIITCNIGMLEINAKATFTFMVRPTAEAVGRPITNIVSVKGGVCDDDSGNNQVIISTPVKPKADLMVEMSASEPEVCVNDPLTYSARVTNKGPNSASDVVLMVTLPANVVIDPPLPPGCVNSGNIITCNIGELNANAPLAPFDFKIRPLPGAGMEIKVIASVTGSVCDPAMDNNQAEVITKVRPLADLAVTKTGPSDPVCAGGEIAYTINFSNNGPNAAPNAKLTDEIPANTVFRSITPPPGSGFTCSGPPVDGTGTVVCTNPNMAANATVSFTLVVRILPSTPNGEEITNTAKVTSDACEKDLANNLAVAKIGVVRRVDLSITKTGKIDPTSPDRINPRLIYTVTVSNKAGCSEAKNIKFIDQILDQSFRYVQFLPERSMGADCRLSNLGRRGLTCDLAGTIAPGESRSITLVFQISRGNERPTICNEVSIGSDTPDSSPVDDYDNFRIDVGGGRPRICRFPTDKRMASK